MPKITIDNKDYDTDTFSDETKNLLGLLQFTEAETQRLQAKLAAMQTARMAYINGLKQSLEKGAAPAPAPQINLSGDTIQFN